MTLESTDSLALVHNSHWTSNIGNPFYSLGVVHALTKALDAHRVMCTDHLSSIVWRPSNAQWQRDLKYPQYSDADWFVLSGPLLNREFVSNYDDILASVPDQTKLVLLSVGGMHYDDEERALCRDFLDRHKPHILFTRDAETYEHYHEFATHSYDGIDFGFFAPDYYEGYPTPRLEPYVTFTFDRQREPNLVLRNLEESPSVEIKRSVLDWLPHRIGKYLPERCPETVEGCTVVRPTHKVLGVHKHLLYKRPNAFFSQTPYGYLNIYRNTKLTVSDRLHAGVATLAYGNPARLASDSPRTRLFRRVGLGDIPSRVVTADGERVSDEKNSMIEELSAIESS